jgi:putative tryptophan/tyrosine transport system substrate-binding protein
MKRRDFIRLFGGVVATFPVAVHAQQSNRIWRIGMLLLGIAEAESLRKELREGLHNSGYIEGRNIQFEVRSADGKFDLLPKLAEELVASKVDVIVALFTPCALAAKRATSEIPIVFMAGDAVGTGVVPSLARPGANLTGLSVLGAELQGKCVELLHDMLPSVRRVAALTNAADPFSKPFVEQVQLAGRASGIEIEPVIMLREPDDIDAAFAAMENARAEAVVMDGSFSTRHVADLALKHRLPAATTPRSFAEAGGLMSYGYQALALYRHMALFVHKVLQGSQPADIPVEQPTKFELVINLKTAKALGIDVPPTLLARADEVIE